MSPHQAQIVSIMFTEFSAGDSRTPFHKTTVQNVNRRSMKQPENGNAHPYFGKYALFWMFFYVHTFFVCFLNENHPSLCRFLHERQGQTKLLDMGKKYAKERLNTEFMIVPKSKLCESVMAAIYVFPGSAPWAGGHAATGVGWGWGAQRPQKLPCNGPPHPAGAARGGVQAGIPSFACIGQGWGGGAEASLAGKVLGRLSRQTPGVVFECCSPR